jgi:vancomycin resistance protein YoaR
MRGRDRRWHGAAPWVLGAVAGLVLVHGVALVALWGLRADHGDLVLAGVHVEDRAVGGADRATLEAEVAQLADARSGATLEVAAGPEELVTDRATAGLEVDGAATVDEAWRRGRRGLWRALGDHVRARLDVELRVDLVTSVDDRRLGTWSDEAAEALSRAPRPAGLGFEVDEDDPDTVEVVPTEPARGQQVEAEDVRAAVADVLAEADAAVVEVEPEETESPPVTEEDLEAVRPDAELAVSAPVVLADPVGDDDVELRPADLAVVLEVVTRPDGEEGERLVLTTDADRLRDHLGEERVEALERDPVDAELAVADGAVEISGGTAGFEVDLELSARRVVELATRPEDRRGELAGTLEEPVTSREDVEALDIVEEVASFSTPLTPGEPRNTNIQRAAELLRGTVVAPDDRFSLDDALGPRTTERGFVENGFIEEDGDLGSTVGGGTSQVATTVLNAVWDAGLEIVEFQPHSQYFERYPEGRESTISRGAIDVVFVNDSPHGVLLWATASESEVTVSVWSTSWAEVDSWIGDREDVEPGEERDGFTVEFGRTVTYPDGSSDSERHRHRYEAAD